MQTSVTKIIDAVTCNGTSTVYSLSAKDDPSQATNSWINVSSGESFSIWVNVSSATGTGNVTVYADLSPLTSSIAYNSTDTTKYQAVNLGTVTSDDTISMKTAENSSTGLQELNYPFCKMRVRVVGTASNPSDTVVTAYLVKSQAA